MEISTNDQDDFSKPSRLIAPPPPTPGALRISTLNHVQRYRQLFPYRNQYTPLQVHNDELTSEKRANQMRFQLIQRALLNDLRGLLEASKTLEQRLKSERTTKWLSHSAIALGTQVIISKLIPSFLDFLSWSRRSMDEFSQRTTGNIQRLPLNPYFEGMLHFLQWFAYPIAFFHISRHEKRISDISILGDGLEDISWQVEQSKELPHDKITCLSDAKWDGIPWHLLEDS
ncbi:hypothetical protein AOQ84DRAFT_377842 [Glonium stellatum]|uniref:Uncharacterized protein n=1 Tax=Glonium stellatum TaxID=574774 RepID=A0A8E2EYM2_9PEZI|nr:hypothetical protein AOQ84DRAFT_377842 [Glonium stellatum]